MSVKLIDGWCWTLSDLAQCWVSEMQLDYSPANSHDYIAIETTLRESSMNIFFNWSHHNRGFVLLTEWQR